MRKFASIQKVLSIESIDNADSIEKITVLGWNIVTKKNEFKVNDLVVYIEIDSLLPEMAIFDFLKTKKYVIRTVKLRGQISQGICFPLDILKNFTTLETIESLKEGDDVTAMMNITKYEPPIPTNMSGKVKGIFPGFMKKTDEIRIQSVPFILEDYKGMNCYIAEKVDGSSMSVYLNKGDYGICSRNMDMTEDYSNALWLVSKKLNLKEKIKNLASLLGLENIAVQGEIIGSGIQGNKYKLDRNDFLIFNIFDVNKYQYIGFLDFIDSCNQTDLKTIPILNNNYILNNTVDELVEMSKGYSKLNNQIKKEGIVIRSIDEMNNIPELDRFSFKVINPEFLIKYNE